MQQFRVPANKPVGTPAVRTTQYNNINCLRTVGCARTALLPCYAYACNNCRHLSCKTFFSQLIFVSWLIMPYLEAINPMTFREMLVFCIHKDIDKFNIVWYYLIWKPFHCSLVLSKCDKNLCLQCTRCILPIVVVWYGGNSWNVQLHQQATHTILDSLRDCSMKYNRIANPTWNCKDPWTATITNWHKCDKHNFVYTL